MTLENTEQRTGRRSRLPLGIAAVAGLVGVVAIVAGVAAGGPGNSTQAAGAAAPLLADATPAPAQTGDAVGSQQGDRPDGGMADMKGRAGRMGGMRAGITITAIDGTRISLRTDDGWTRTTDASGATISKGGATASVGDLKVGDQVAFHQQRGADGTYAITRIEVVAPHVDGTVTATATGSITLKAPDGSVVNVVVTPTTTFQVAGKTSATVADVTVGSIVVATGTRNADRTFTATAVRAFTPRQDGQGGPGWNGGLGRPGMMGPGRGRDDQNRGRGPWGQPNQTPVPGA